MLVKNLVHMMTFTKLNLGQASLGLAQILFRSFFQKKYVKFQERAHIRSFQSQFFSGSVFFYSSEREGTTFIVLYHFQFPKATVPSDQWNSSNTLQ